MEIVIISLLAVLIVLAIIILTAIGRSGKNPKLEDSVSRLSDRISEIPLKTEGQLSDLKQNITKQFGEARLETNKEIQENFRVTNETIITRINDLNNKVNGTLEENFKTTNETFQNVIKRLAVIDEAQKKMDTVSSEIVSLQDILTDKKMRGAFGEVNLNIILANIFGEAAKGPDKLYDLQHTLSTGARADAVVNAPEPLGMLCIDSKFPLENYRRMVDRQLSVQERDIAEKQFKNDVKNHINAIADKYIISGETAEQAIMFVPAEAIFAEIHAYHDDLVAYAQARRVWVTSPSTLMGSLATILMVVKDLERNKYAKEIQDNLSKLAAEFGRYKDRWDNLSKHIETVSKDVKEINTTTDKITRRFDDINNANFQQALGPAEIDTQSM